MQRQEGMKLNKWMCFFSQLDLLFNTCRASDKPLLWCHKRTFLIHVISLNKNLHTHILYVKQMGISFYQKSHHQKVISTHW